MRLALIHVIGRQGYVLVPWRQPRFSLASMHVRLNSGLCERGPSVPCHVEEKRRK